MTPTRRVSVVLAVAMTVGLALAPTVSASTGTYIFHTLGNGATAQWTNAPADPVDGVTYTDTMLVAFNEVLAPRAQGHTQSAVFFQNSYQFDGDEFVWDSFAYAFFDGASVQIQQPLLAATAAGTGTLTTCDADGCNDTPMSFSAQWSGNGAVLRAPKHPIVTVTPTVSVYLSMGGGDIFVRPASATLQGVSLPAGSYLLPPSPEGEGTTIFQALFGYMSICRNGTPDWNSSDLPLPCVPDA